MFEFIREGWARARAENLRDEYNYTMAHFTDFMAGDVDGTDDVDRAAQSCYQRFSRNFGELRALSDREKKVVVKEIQSVVRGLSKTHLGSAIGASFVAMWLESTYLPGEDAARVTELATEALRALDVLD